MKQILFLMFAGILLGNTTYSQSEKKSEKSNLPQEKVTVNKEFDENGNMISFDSTYVYSWSGDSTMTNLPDSIDFSDFFNWKESFFDNDSAFSANPFKRFQFNDKEIENFFNYFSKTLPDSIDMYPHPNDSVNRFFNDSTQFLQFWGDNLIPDFHWQLNDSTMRNRFPEPELKFQNDSIWKKHQKLLEKHMQEMEEFQKKFFQF